VIRSGKQILDPRQGVYEGYAPRIRGANFWNNIWKISGLPGRFLAAGDDLTKTIVYRSHVRAMALEDIAKRGVTHPYMIASELDNAFRAAFGPSGQGLIKRSLDYSRELSFTDQATGKLATTLIDWAEQIPLLRTFVPFIRTPSRLFTHMYQRTPVLGAFQKEMAADIAAGGERAQSAMGKQMMGSLLWVAGIGLAMNSSITGRGVSNPQMRDTMRKSGWLPYHINLPFGQRIDMRRLYPFSAPLMFIADFVQYYGELQRAYDSETIMDAVSAGFSALVSNITSQTYLQSVVDLVEGIGGSEPWRMRRFFENYATSRFVPYSMLWKQTARGEQGWREANTVLERLMRNLPYFNEKLDPQYNWFGEMILRTQSPVHEDNQGVTLPPGFFQGVREDPIGWTNRAFSPYRLAAQWHDPVLDELTDVGRGIPMPSRFAPGTAEKFDLQDRGTWGADVHGGVSPYARAMQLMNTRDVPGFEGKNTREYVQDYMQTDEWVEFGSWGTEEIPGGNRRQALKEILNGRFLASLNEVMNDPAYKGLREAIGYHQMVAYASTGGQAEVDRVTSMFQQSHERNPEVDIEQQPWWKER
jgi:hypothetical protein